MKTSRDAAMSWRPDDQGFEAAQGRYAATAARISKLPESSRGEPAATASSRADAPAATASSSDAAPAAAAPEPEICPLWVARLLASPLRRLTINPDTVVRPYVRPGMTVVDVGCAAGFFTLPLARRVGASGRVVAVDLRPELLDLLARRVDKAGVASRIEARLCTSDRLGLADLAGAVDFVLAMHVVHEAPEAARFLAELRDLLPREGRILLAEPRGHVDPPRFDRILAAAAEVGLAMVAAPRVRFSRSVLLAPRRRSGAASSRSAVEGRSRRARATR